MSLCVHGTFHNAAGCVSAERLASGITGQLADLLHGRVESRIRSANAALKSALDAVEFFEERREAIPDRVYLTPGSLAELRARLERLTDALDEVAVGLTGEGVRGNLDSLVNALDADGNTGAEEDLHGDNVEPRRAGRLSARLLESGGEFVIDGDLQFSVTDEPRASVAQVDGGVARHGSPSVGAVSDTASPTVGAVPGVATSGTPGTNPEGDAA